MQAHTAHIVETEDISLTQDKRVVCARGSVCVCRFTEKDS